MEPPVILVIDTDSAAHDRVADALADEHCVLLGARSESLAIYLARRRPPNVVIVDAESVRSPSALVERLQSIVPNLRALVTTRNVRDGGVARLGSVGPILPKPIDVDRLQSTVRSLSRLSAMTSGVADLRADAIATHAVWRRIATVRERP
jgi:DNA-binding response OmpR family regulator